MKRETKKELVSRLLISDEDYSYDYIALRANCSTEYVKKIQKENCF